MATAPVKKTATKKPTIQKSVKKPAKAKTTTFSPFMKRSMDALKGGPSWGAMIAPPSSPVMAKR